MKKVILTGATGLIGQYSIESLLEKGFEVFAISTKEQPKSDITWIKADLLNFSDLKKVFEEVKPDYLLHFGWDVTHGKYLESESNVDWLKSSLEMLKCFKNNGGKRAVFAGTCFEYELGDDLLKEYETPTNPATKYGKCKNELNQMANLYAKENDISFGWGRIFYVYGKNENPNRLIPYIINNLKNNQQVILKSGDLIKDYLYGKDIAAAFVEFLDSQIQGDVNICSNNPIKIKDMALLIAQKLNKNNLLELQPIKNNEPQIILGDNTRLTQEVGYIYKYSLESGIEDLLKESL
ncbi:MAG: NAD(P)-dependent oxidoreductase [bacterium]